MFHNQVTIVTWTSPSDVTNHDVHNEERENGNNDSRIIFISLMGTVTFISEYDYRR